MKTKLIKTGVGFLKSLIFPVGMYLLFLIITTASGKSGYFSSNAFNYIFGQSVLSTVVALAIAIPLSGGRWDFATGTIAVLGGIIGTNLGIAMGLNSIGILALMIIVCVALAVIEGLLYIFTRVSTIIVSLGVVMIYEALTNVLFDGQGAQLYTHPDLIVIAQAPWSYVILVVVMVLVYFFLGHTRFGYDTRSLGSNARLAINNGVNEKKNILLTYVMVGALLGVAAMLNAAKGNIAPASNLSSTSLMFSSMGPVLIGLFLSRYSNLPLGVFMGAIGMTSMSYGMVVLGIDSSIQTIVLGVIIVLIMAYTSNSDKLSGAVATLRARLSKKKTAEQQ